MQICIVFHNQSAFIQFAIDFPIPPERFDKIFIFQISPINGENKANPNNDRISVSIVNVWNTCSVSFCIECIELNIN